jgi:hypothetical protein
MQAELTTAGFQDLHTQSRKRNQSRGTNISSCNQYVVVQQEMRVQEQK